MEIELPSNLLRIGDGAFSGTGLSGTYVIPDSVVYMGDNVFPENVDTIVIPASVFMLGEVEKSKTIITTAGSVAETVITEKGGNVVIISEEEMAAYQAVYQAGKLGFVPKSTSVPEVTDTPEPTPESTLTSSPTPEPTPVPEENQPAKIVETSYVQDIEAKYSWLGGANGVIITREMIGWGTDYYGAIDYYGNELVPRQHMYHFNTVNGNGWFAMQDYGGDALVMNAEGDIAYRVSNPYMVWLGEEKIIYGFWTDGKQDSPACDLACYDIATGTVEVWQENYAVDKNPYFTVATCGGYGAVTWHNFNRAGIMSPGYCKSISGNDKLYEYYQTLEGADICEAYSIDMDEFYALKGIPADAIWTYGNTYYDGQYRMNIGKQMVIPVGQNQDYTYYLVDFEKAQVREAEYVNGAGQTCKEYLVTNIADIIVAEYDYIELSPTGIYLAATGDDYFYIDATGNKIADYDDCSSFNTNGYALALENGMAYVINTDFEKVSEGYPAERVYVALDALALEYGDKVTYLFPMNQEEAAEFEQKEQELDAAESLVPGMQQGIYMQVDPRYDYGNFYAELEADVLLLHCGLEVYSFASGHMTENNGEYIFENADGKLQITRVMSNYMFIYDRNTPNNKDDDLRYEMMLAEEVFDFIPLAGYESLDAQGEWGAIPVTEEIKSLLLEGMTDDYRIRYVPQYSLYGYTYDEYEAVCYDGKGGQSASVYVYVYDSEETATRKFTETKWEVPEQCSLHGNMIRYDKRESANTFSMRPKWSDTDTFVYGEHCYHEERWNTYYYYSKIMSEEELKERNYISEFIATYAGDYYEGGAYNGRYIRVDGSAYEPNYFVVMLDDVYYSRFHDVTVTELNHLQVLGHDEQQKISYVLDIVINGYDLTAAIMEYSYDPELSFENYIQKTKTKECFFKGSIPSGVRGFPMF